MEYTPEQLKRAIRVPSGESPLKFGLLCLVASLGCLPSEPVIIAWFWEIRKIGLRRGEFYTAEAIAYFARYEYGPTTNEYQEIEEIIYDYARNINDPFCKTETEKQA